MPKDKPSYAMIEAQLQDAMSELVVLRNSGFKVKDFEARLADVANRELNLEAAIAKVKLENYKDRFKDSQLTIEALREAISKIDD